MVTTTLYARQKKRHRCIEQTFGLYGRSKGGMIWENSIETCILSSVKQMASPRWMHETSAQGWCTGKTQKNGMGSEVGGRFRMGNTCKSMTDSCRCMAKTTTILWSISLKLIKIKEKIILRLRHTFLSKANPWISSGLKICDVVWESSMASAVKWCFAHFLSVRIPIIWCLVFQFWGQRSNELPKDRNQIPYWWSDLPHIWKIIVFQQIFGVMETQNILPPAYESGVNSSNSTRIE